MKMQGFHATYALLHPPCDLLNDCDSERMFKSRLESWGLGKNASRQDWHAFALLMEERRVAGLPLCRTLIHNKPKTHADFRRYLKEQKMGELDFLREATMAGTSIPLHVRVEAAYDHEANAGVGETFHAPETSSQETCISSCEPDQSTTWKMPLFSCGFLDEPIDWSFDENFDPVMPDYMALLPGAIAPPPPNPELGHIIEDTYDLESWMIFPEPENVPSQIPNPEEGNISGVAKGKKRRLEQVTAEDRSLPSRTPSIHISEMLSIQSTTVARLPSHRIDCDATADVRLEQDDASSFMAACMAACMYGALERYDIMSKSLHRADLSTRKMCASDNPLLMSAIATILAWLRVHAEGSLPESILRSTYHAAIEVLGESHAICLLLEWMTAAAAGSLLHCRIKSATLRKICRKIIQTYGNMHSNSIVASYCLGFQLVHEKSYQEAETFLQDLYAIATKALGPSDLQTINILATISRAQSRQGKYLAALDTINCSLNGAPLGLNHPHRLELMIRKALIYRKLGRMGDVQKLYWVIVEGRAATLGVHHVSTQKAYDSLVTILQDNGTWESLKGKAQRLLTKPQVAVTEDESAWQVMVLKMEQATKDERVAQVEVE